MCVVNNYNSFWQRHVVTSEIQSWSPEGTGFWTLQTSFYWHKFALSGYKGRRIELRWIHSLLLAFSLWPWPPWLAAAESVALPRAAQARARRFFACTARARRASFRFFVPFLAFQTRGENRRFFHPRCKKKGGKRQNPRTDVDSFSS